MDLLADAINPTSLLDYIQSGGIIGLLILFVVGFYKKWWVMGWQYKAIEASNAKWMELALRSANLAESLDTIRKSRQSDF